MANASHGAIRVRGIRESHPNRKRIARPVPTRPDPSRPEKLVLAVVCGLGEITTQSIHLSVVDVRGMDGRCAPKSGGAR